MLRFETISSKDMDKYVKNTNAVIIDVRDKEQYRKCHIENAVNIPFDELLQQYGKMPRNKILVLYCEHGGTGILAAKELYDRGFVVRALVGGISGYRGTHLKCSES